MGVFDKFLNRIHVNDDDGFDDDEFLDDEIEEYEEEPKPKKRFFSKHEDDDDFDDYGYDETLSAKKSKTTAKKQSTVAPKPRTTAQTASKSAASSKISPIRTKKSSSGMNICAIRPRSMEDTSEITTTLLSGCTVILNLEGMDMDLAQRVIDYTSGTCFAVDGSIQKISNYIFIIAPSDVDISGDFQQILNGAFDMAPFSSKF